MDEANSRLTVQADTEGGDPLQRCLRGSARGGRVLLIAYRLPANRRAQPERAGRSSFTPTPTLATSSRAAATHAASETGELACGTWTRLGAPVTEIGTDLASTTCRFCRAELGLDADEGRRLEALFVLSITLGLRPGELRRLAWDHVDLDNGVIHVWRSASRTGDVKTPKSKRSLMLPKRAVAALQAHKKLQAAERLAAACASCTDRRPVALLPPPPPAWRPLPGGRE